MTERTFDKLAAGDIVEENVSFRDFLERYESQHVEWDAGKVIMKVSNNEKPYVTR